MSPAHTERTSTGLTANVAAAASYFLGFVTGIMFLLSFLLRSNHPRKADAQAMAH